MSVKALTCAMALRDVSPTEKLLLLALANYADEHMRCYPSQKRLAEDTCLSDRSIRSLLAQLEGRRIISRQERQRADNSRATDLITLHFFGEVAEAASGGAEMVSGGVGKQLPGGGEAASALTTFEPSPEPSEEPLECGVRERADFTAFWAAYPRKTAKDKARLAFPRAIAKASLATMLAALSRQREWEQWRRGVIPHPATWLNQARWNDEEPPQSRKAHERLDPRKAHFAERLGDIDAAMAAAFEQPRERH
jgi:hypothetical protein